MARPPTLIDGSRVRKLAHSGSHAGHRLLRAMRVAGIDFVPEPIAIEGPHEILSFMPGVCYGPTETRPADAWDPHLLHKVGQAIRICHDVSETFLAENPVLSWFPYEEQCPCPEVICHNDLGPWNVPVHEGVVSLIDWEMAAPGLRIWDVAHIAWNWVPLYAPEDRALAGVPQCWEVWPRIEELLRGYGGNPWSREDLLRAVLERQVRVLELVRLAQTSGAELLGNWALVATPPIERDREFTQQLLKLLRDG